jgi:hypothetical protein
MELIRVEALTVLKSNGWLSAFPPPPHITLGWKRLTVSNTLAYKHMEKNLPQKGFIVKAPGGQSHKTVLA